MDNEWFHTLECPQHDLVVTIDIGQEHHMGAAPVLIRLSHPLCEVQEFTSTNGSAFLIDDPPMLVVQDACVILLFELPSGQVFHLLPPRNWYFTNVRVEDGRLTSDLYKNGTPRQIAPIPLTEVAKHLQQGFGPVVAGRFPSAYP